MDDSTQDADRALVDAARRGDRTALERLLERHADRIHGLCRRILGNRDDALDATQEAMLAIARGIGRFDGRAAFTTWLYRVATNAALDEARRRSRRPVPQEQVPETPAREPGPENMVVDRAVFDAALAVLPTEFRVAVVLRDACDLEYSEIARVLGVPPGTVRSRIARGRALLAGELGNQDAAPERRTLSP